MDCSTVVDIPDDWVVLLVVHVGTMTGSSRYRLYEVTKDNCWWSTRSDLASGVISVGAQCWQQTVVYEAISDQPRSRPTCSLGWKKKEMDSLCWSLS